MELFNNREIALILWSAFLLSCMLLKADYNLTIKPLLKSLFVRRLMILLGIVVLYLSVSVALLNILDLWDYSQIKNTLAWFFIVSLPDVFRTSKADNPPVFSEVLKSNLGLLVVVEFLVNSYSFNLLAELFLVPISTALIIYISLSKEVRLKRFAENLLCILGAILILRAVFQLFENYSNFMNLGTFQDFSTPVLLSVAYFPFIYALYYFLRYERLNVGLQCAIKNEELRRYIKPRALLKLHFNMTSLERWKNSLFLSDINSKESALESIERIKNILKKERNNRYVSRASGWQPQEAKDFLIEKGLPTGHYNSHDDESWYAFSSYYEVETGVFPNNIAYYVDGSSEVATKLRLVMNINSEKMIVESFAKYIEFVEALLWHALKEPLLPSVKEAIYKGKNMLVQIKRSEISYVKEELPNHFNDGYRVELSISSGVNNHEKE